MINAGEHEFIERLSYVSYEHCQQRMARHLEEGVANKLFSPKKPVNSALFNRIFDGVARSKFTKPFVNHYI